MDDFLRCKAVPNRKGANFRDLPGVVTHKDGTQLLCRVPVFVWCLQGNGSTGPLVQRPRRESVTRSAAKELHRLPCK